MSKECTCCPVHGPKKSPPLACMADHCSLAQGHTGPHADVYRDIFGYCYTHDKKDEIKKYKPMTGGPQRAEGGWPEDYERGNGNW